MSATPASRADAASQPGTDTPASPASVHRLTITAIGDDPRAAGVLDAAHALGISSVRAVTYRDVVFIDGPLLAEHLDAIAAVLVDPLLQHGTWDLPPTDDDSSAIEVVLHPGVADDVADAVLVACGLLEIPARRAAGGRRIEFDGDLDASEIGRLAQRVIANEVIERWSSGVIEPPFAPSEPGESIIETIAIRGLDEAALAALNAERALHLDPAEMAAIASHFESIGRDPTDAELETFAQTWSEHCAHKTFRARLIDEDGNEIVPLLRQLRDATDDIAAPWVRSAFVGNAGIVAFAPGTTIALKAETHNHPSAIEPFGGANTGVGGVIRDVLGIGHEPIAVTDILCFGPPDLPIDEVPAGALHPRRIREGVVAGVADYGNKIGLPTVAGAVLYDPGYTLTPLVYAGCIGVAPDEVELPMTPAAGDHVVLLGGRTGRDGLGGATFSSATMDASTGEVAGARVQIGSPIMEKLVSDVLRESRHLYRAITDCGAGGLSSAVGEMAEGLGVEVHLERVPLKYPGLQPWEIWLSEAQERMVLAVAPEHVDELAERCRAHGVPMADLGVFDDSGRLVVRSDGRAAVDVDLGFLHDGRPQRQMTLTMPTPERSIGETRRVDDLGATLLEMLTHRNLASKADIIRRFDHEIRGATRARPLTGIDHDAPGDAVVLVEPGADHGLAIGIGVNPWYGLSDPEAMARAAVDEAIRSVVAAGADPDRIALLDNFSWGDPRRPETLGGLAAAVRGCADAARAHGAPFVSGKDSLNNEYLTSDGVRTPVPPTLVITAVGHVPGVDGRIGIGMDPLTVGNALVMIGRTAPEFGGSHLDLVTGGALAGLVPQPDPAAPARYRALYRAIASGLVVSAHDISEGGLAVALAEMVIASGLGIETAPLDELGHEDVTVALFAESVSRIILEVAPADLGALAAVLDEPVVVVGHLTDSASLVIGDTDIDRDRLCDAHHRRGLEP